VLCHSAVFYFKNAALAAWLAGVPNLVSILYSASAYSRPKEHTRHWGMPGIGLWWHRLRMNVRLVVLMSDCVLFATRQHAWNFHRAYELPPRNSWIVPHLGADVHEFRPQPDIQKMVRQRYGISANEICILYVGRLSSEKGPDILIEAVGLMRTANLPRIRVLMAGAGPEVHNLTEQVTSMNLQDRVRFLGQTRNVAELLAAADVVVVPSRVECFGLSLVEAMSAGCAVVATKVGGMQEIVIDGQSGLLAEPECPAMLAEKLELLVGDSELRHRMGIQARTRIMQMYSKNHVLESLYSLILRKGSGTTLPQRWTHAAQADITAECRKNMHEQFGIRK
jgi:glycosyltransferase involved in cell wall biosynthesis